jgi:uncharacterized membrane protein
VSAGESERPTTTIAVGPLKLTGLAAQVVVLVIVIGIGALLVHSYAFVRHPIYSAMLGMFLGTALVSGDLHAFVGVALIVGAYVRKIRLEEQSLADVFGVRYDDYRRSTRALIPGVY